MILHWDQLALHYGDQLNAHRAHFEHSGQTTYGLLACRFSPQDDKLSFSNGDHAEQRLIESTMWRQDVPAALGQHGPHSSPIVVTLLVNRSTCRSCARLLCRELDALHSAHPASAEANRFILACRGVYEPADMAGATTHSDLVALDASGWELCVLQVGAQLTSRGEILRQSIERIRGRGIVRLG